ncbi:MAG: MASE4 domain-containing protein [Acidobacteria bacterium]|nr:MASE4 domain-containing protein [Acidobacteriota bacterium]
MESSDTTHALYLDHKKATPRTWLLALAMVLMLFVVFLALLPFVTVPLAASTAFIPAYESGLIVIELLTAIVLLGQFTSGAGTRVLILGCGYLFNAAIIVVHALSFPGAFGPTGVIGGGAQTTAWLYIFWHGGFPLFVMAFAAYNEAAPATQKGRTWRTLIALTVLTCLVVSLGLVSTIGHDLLPVVVKNGNYRLLVELGISPVLVVLCIIALVGILRRPQRSVLDVWLCAVMVIWIFDITLSAVVGSARYDLGWYAGRVFGLAAGTFILGVLLIEANLLHGNLARALQDADQSKEREIASREEMARGQRLEAMGQLTGGIAHDFNNVLQVIGASISLLKFKFKDRPDAIDLIERALTAVNRGARLSGELLSFGRRQSLQPRVVDVAQMVVAMAEVAQRTLGKSIEVRIRVAPELWHTTADPSRLENALLNLILNARDAILENGTIVLGAENVRDGFFDFAQFADVPTGDYVRLTVNDNGNGIPAEVLPRVLEPFFSTKTMAEGTGLGLSMVHGFAKQSNVRCTVNSGHSCFKPPAPVC